MAVNAAIWEKHFVMEKGPCAENFGSWRFGVRTKSESASYSKAYYYLISIQESRDVRKTGVVLTR